MLLDPPVRAGARPSATRVRRLGGAALWLIAASLAVRMAVLAAQGLDRPANGFVTYYTAARLVLGGEPLAGLYERAWFAERIKQYEPTVYDFFRPNPPPAALIVAPVALLPYRTARAAWVWLNLAAYVAIVLYLGRAAGFGRLALPAFVCLAFAFQSIHDVLRNGQVYVLVLALAVVAWRGYLRRREAVLGGALAVLGTFKVMGVWIVAQLVAERRWRALAWTAVVGLVIVLASLPLVGVPSWIAAVGGIVAVPGEFGLSVTAYQSLYGFFHHLFTPVTLYNPRPLVNAPALATALSWLSVIVVVGTSAFVAARRRGDDVVMAAFVLVGLLVMPVSASTHYLIALLAVAILLARLGRNPARLHAAMLCAGIIAMMAEVPFKSPRLAEGVVTLLAYPKLYGALVLWALALRLAWLGPLPQSVPARAAAPAHGRPPRSAVS
jgi:alpha-1,2-mannosyltransferase